MPTLDKRKSGFIKIYSINRQCQADGTPWLSASIHTNLGYTHYFVNEGLAGFLEALASHFAQDGSYDRIAK